MKRNQVQDQGRLLRISLLLLIAMGMVFAPSAPTTYVQAQSSSNVKPIVIYADSFAESLPVSELPPEPIKEVAATAPSGAAAQPDAAGALGAEEGDEDEPIVEVPMLPLPKGDAGAEGAAGPMASSAKIPSGLAESSAAQTLSIPSPIVGFDGLSSQDNFNAFGFRVSPPDTNGDVGPNRYVQIVNLLVRVYDKAGNPLTAPFKLSSLFAPLGGQCTASDQGDPIALYDPLADRWLLSQFAFTGISTPPYHECIAISKTGDPTGAYFLYDFITPGNEFPDYPKLGVWPDAYYMTVNQFTGGGPFNGTGAYAFDRAKMLAGDPTASLIYFNLNLASHPEGIGGMLPSDLDGLTPPPGGRPNTFAYFIATEFGDASDGLRLFDFHADFANPLNSTFTERAESPVAVAAFDPRSPAGRDDIQQPPPATNSAALDAIADRLMHRLQYRNSGGTESLVTNHTVNVSGSTVLGTYRAGVRYYQLTSTGGAFTVAEQATFAPADGNSRWMGSAAVDNQGNLAVGYSVSSITTFPSIRYAGRLASDPPGGLFQGEATLAAGTGVQTSTGSRWGDYSALSVDPADDCTFWYTNEYYTAASQASSSVGWLTRVGSFRFAGCTPSPQGTLQGTVTNANTSAPVSGALIQVPNGSSRASDVSGNYSMNLAPGTYTVTASKFGFVTASAVVVVTNGGTTIQDFALTPIPVMTAAGSAITAESFPQNGVIDPAETVTVDFTLQNIGPGDTSNLVATLLATGGVLNPSGPQTYGVIANSGGTGTRAFTFRADPAQGCGGTLVATLHLQDGALDLGTVTYTFTLGVPRVPLTENFDGVTAPALPAGWTATVAAGLSTNNWRTVTTNPDSAPNAAFVPDPSTVHDIRLDSPSVAIQTASAQVTFRNNFDLETGFDGGVLEISLDGGPFVDILAAGGSFVSGGYNRTLSTAFQNPIGGRQAWSGNSNGYITTIVNLPASAAGKAVQLRWRLGTDRSVADVGWRVDTITVSDGFACTFNLVAAGSAITAESFPPNGAIDPGEKVTVNFTLRNDGTTSSSNLMATLLATGGVTNPSGPQAYGAVAGSGGTGTQAYTFKADPALPCGGTLVATLHLQDGALDLGTVTYTFTLGVPRVPLTENFDGVTAPALPAGWTATVAAGLSTNNWRTVTTSPDSAPNAAFVPDPSTVHDIRLDSPTFAIQTSVAQVTFRNNFITEAGFDGGVLEISLNGGPFTDILAAGGSFVTGGYNRTLSTGFSNPLPGRQAWSGNSNGYITTKVNLPASAAGANVRLRWRFGSDSSVSGTGWRVDTISISDGFACAINAAPTVIVNPASQTVQYSDVAMATIAGSDTALDTPLVISTEWNANGGSFTAGLPAWLSLTDNGCTTSGNDGTCTWTLSGNALTAPGTYVVRATVSDDASGSTSADITIVVAQEDGRATYTGALFAATSSTSSSTADVTLAATIQDITAADPGSDAHAGDIRNAAVTFVDRDNGNATLCTAPVGLVDPADTKTGTATCTWTADLGNANSLTARVGIVVDHFYTRNSPEDDALVTVSKPLPSNFITGGGYLMLANSAGHKAGDAGSKNNFGFNVKYNRGGTNLQGKINIIVRRTESDGLHVYQIKGNVMTSLAVQPGPGTATFNGKASIQDVTNPLAPIPVEGNATLQVTMDDNGEPGASDTIGVTVWNKSGGLWFASQWNGARTVEQLLDGGNLVVR